ncbi:MAG TPA: DUF5671 domain-containing protein [Acidobacteriaceae bacterium]
MPTGPGIAEFIEKALAAGIPHDALVGILTARGWPEKEVYDALAVHYQRLTGIEVPRRAAAAVASAKDAFFYLLIFATLATWTIAFGCLAFALIDRWIADPLFFGYQQSYDSYAITASLAALIVAFPLYLLISRTVAGEAAQHPEKLESSVRKWLTYLALVIAACVLMGDLIAVLTHLLRGELTSRFVLKALVVLALSGGVFFHYFSGLRRTDTAPARQSRDRRMAALSSAIVALMLVLGFWQLGSPARQRQFRADAQRVQQLFQLTSQIKNYWSSHASQLPPNLDQLPGNASANAFVDPITRVPYDYHPRQGSQYELCANFARSSERSDLPPGQRQWIHPAGHHCFKLDATAMEAYPTVQYPMD